MYFKNSKIQNFENSFQFHSNFLQKSRKLEKSKIIYPISNSEKIESDFENFKSSENLNTPKYNRMSPWALFYISQVGCESKF